MSEARGEGGRGGFELRLTQGAAQVCLTAAPLHPGGEVSELVLGLSDVTPPLDASRGAAQFRDRLCDLERLELVVSEDGLAELLAALPLGDVGVATLALAPRAGIASAFPWADTQAAIRAGVDRLYESKRGAIMGTQFDAAWVRMMEGAGWWSPGYTTADELWKRSLESGGWWDPFYDHGDWGRVLRTASGRFDFRPDVVRQFAESSTPKLDGGGALALILFEPLPTAGGTGAELPFLQGLLDPGHEERWATWGEIHPETAKALRIREGTRVRVATAHDAIVVHARITERVVPGAVAIPLGLGKSAGGRWAEGIGANPLRLLDSAREPFSMLPDFGAGKVLVSEATS